MQGDFPTIQVHKQYHIADTAPKMNDVTNYELENVVSPGEGPLRILHGVDYSVLFFDVPRIGCTPHALLGQWDCATNTG